MACLIVPKGNLNIRGYSGGMAREKYLPEELYRLLSDPIFWTTWVDRNGEVHHTPRSLLGILPDDAQIIE